MANKNAKAEVSKNIQGSVEKIEQQQGDVREIEVTFELSETETPEPPVNQTPIVKPKPAKESSGFCVYLGPSIHGVIIRGTIFDANKAVTLGKIDNILKDYPQVAGLIVPDDVLPKSLVEVKKPGNLLYANYSKFFEILRTKQGGNTNG